MKTHGRRWLAAAGIAMGCVMLVVAWRSLRRGAEGLGEGGHGTEATWAARDAADARAHGPSNKTPSRSLSPGLRRSNSDDGMRSGWSREEDPARQGFAGALLGGLRVMTRISDALVEDPARTPEMLAELLRADGVPEERIRTQLGSYPVGSETLADMQSRGGLNPELRTVRAAMESAGVRWDTGTDCLLDGRRLVVGLGELRDFVEGIQESLATAFDGADAAAEVMALEQEWAASEEVLTDWFRGRLVRRHGLTEAEAESVLRALLPLRAPTATVSDLYVPIRPGG